jgi:hypothetical protein
MEKTIRTIGRIAIIFAVAFVMILVFLRVAFPPAKIKAIMENYAKNEFDREISFDKSSFRIIGASLHNFSVSEKGGFGNGVFINVKKLSFKVRLLPLLKKNISVYGFEADELFMDIIKKDGKYNIFSERNIDIKTLAVYGLQNAGKQKNEFTISEININKAQIQYFDRDKNTIYTVSGLSAFSKNVQLRKAFETKLKFIFSYYNEEAEKVEIPVNALLSADLKDMNPLTASLKIESLNMLYNNTKIAVKAEAKNLLAPDIKISAEADVFTQNTLKDIMPAVIAFKFDKFIINSDFVVDFINKTFIFKSLDLFSGNSVIKSSGNIDYGHENKTIDFRQTMSLDVTEVLRSFDKHFDNLSIAGNVNAETRLTNKGITAQAHSENLSAEFKKAGAAVDGFSAKSVFEADFSSGKINFSNLDFFVANSTVNFAGVYDIKKRGYNFSASSLFDIKQAVSMFGKRINDYYPEGNADISFTLSNSGIKGNVVLKDAAVKYLSVFEAAGLNGKIVFNSIDNVKISSMTGTLNGEKFTFSASYLKDLRDIMLSLNFKTDKFYLPVLPENKENAAGAAKDNISVKAGEIPYTLHLKLSANAGSAEIPHVKLKTLNINADLKNITRLYDRIKGFLSFSAGETVIEDIDGLIKKNGFAKSVLSPLNAVNKAAKEAGIKIFGKNDQAVSFKFSKIEGKTGFTQGFINIEKLKLSSADSYINATGDVGLQTRDLNLRLTVSPISGNSFVIKMDGSADEPKVHIDLVGSIFTLIDALQKTGTN